MSTQLIDMIGTLTSETINFNNYVGDTGAHWDASVTIGGQFYGGCGANKEGALAGLLNTLLDFGY